MLQELDSRREDDRHRAAALGRPHARSSWLHVQEDAGAEHVVGVPAPEAQDAFLCPSLYVGFERALEAVGSARARPRLTRDAA